MRQSIFKIFPGLLIVLFLCSACTSQTGRSYSASETRQSYNVKFGVIEQLNDAVIEDEPSGLGVLGGGAAGAVAGSLIGGGSARVYSGLAGAAIGALAGTALEKKIRTKNAQEIMVRLDDNDEKIVVVQQIDEQERLSVGDRVRVILSYDGAARVRRQ